MCDVQLEHLKITPQSYAKLEEKVQTAATLCFSCIEFLLQKEKHIILNLNGRMQSSLPLVRSSSHSSQSSLIHIHTCPGLAPSKGGSISIQRSIRPLNDKKAGGWLAGGEIFPDRLLVSWCRLPACLPAPPPSSRAAVRAGLEPELPSSPLPLHLHGCIFAVHSPPTPPITIIIILSPTPPLSL